MISSTADLLRTLARHGNLIEGLFEKRERSVPVQEARGDLPYEVLQYLSDENIIEISDDSVELDEHLIKYLEYYFNADDEAEVLDYDNLLGRLEHHIGTLVGAETPDTIRGAERRIRKILRRLPSNLLRNIMVIRRHIELTYKVISEPEEKLRELEHYRGEIESLRKAEGKITQKLSAHRDGFFGQYAGVDLRLQYYRLLSFLHDFRSTMVDLNNEVIDYINKLGMNTRFHKHILRLRDLMDRHEIRERTNLLPLLSSGSDDLVLIPQQYDRAMLPREFGRSEEFVEIYRSIGEASAPSPTKKMAGPASPEALGEKEPYPVIDFDALYRGFLESGEDLLSYVSGYPYERDRGEEELLYIYLQIATTYSERLRFDTRNPLHFGGFRCAKIYPKGELP